MDFSFNIDAIAEQKASKNREIDSQVGSMESEASRCENQANSFDTQAASMEAMAVAAAARTITVPDGTDSDGHTRYKTIPCPDGQAQAAALKAQAAALKSQAAQLRAHAGAIRGGVSALRGAQTATNKYLDGIVELAQRVDLTNAQKLGQMAADIQQYTKNMTDIMNSFNDSFPLVSKDLNPLEKSVLATVVAKVANDIKQAVNVDEVVRDSLEVLPSEMKSDIEAHAKSLGKNMSELTAQEAAILLDVVALDPKYINYNINENPSTGGLNPDLYLVALDIIVSNLSVTQKVALIGMLGLGTEVNKDNIEKLYNMYKNEFYGQSDEFGLYIGGIWFLGLLDEEHGVKKQADKLTLSDLFELSLSSSQFSDSKWKDYMQNNQALQTKTKRILEILASELNNSASKNVDLKFDTFQIDNGESLIGYDLLHCVNADSGGFVMKGTISKNENGDITYDIRYEWNDIIDPNLEYTSDIEKSEEAGKISTPRDYPIHISWSDKSIINANSNNNNSGWLSTTATGGRTPVKDLDYSTITDIYDVADQDIYYGEVIINE